MNVLIAPDSFKESLSATAAADLIEAGFRDVFPNWDYVKLPVADGGEGTVAAIIAATGGRIVPQRVTGPLGDPVNAFFGLLDGDQTAVIEIAASSGLPLLNAARRNPLLTTTYGVGELIRAAMDLGARRIVVGIGGSATNDGGAGMVQALGAKLLDGSGQEIGFGGTALAVLARIDVTGLDPRLIDCEFDVACDVDSPLVGPNGASVVFGPQKGATPEMVKLLDANLRHYAARIESDLGRSVLDLRGGGAAGGLGAAMVAFLNARLLPGAELIMEIIGLEALVAEADLIITGEGRIDGQSVRGKTPLGIARAALDHGKPVIALAGSLGQGAELLHDHGVSAMLSVVPGACSLDQALAAAGENLRNTSRNTAELLRIGADIVKGS
jgi:glycerate kinase